MSTYAQLLELLSDRAWHCEDELRSITPFPREWMKELSYDGHEVAADESGTPVVRLKE
jgi:hypothetical protein